MSDEQPGSEQHAESTPPAPPAGNRWGEAISPQRAIELRELADPQRAWAAAPDHQGRESYFKNVPLTGADVFWLAAYALAGPDGDVAYYQEALRSPGETFSRESLYASALHWEEALLVEVHVEHVEERDPLEESFLQLDRREVHLEGAHLWKAHLEEADLRHAHLEGAHLHQAHLERALLREAHLEGADLTEAYLEGADLTEAHLEGKSYPTGDADLTRIRQGAPDFPQTLLPADLRGTSFDRATSLDHTTLGNAMYGRISVLGTWWGKVDLSAVEWGEPERKGLWRKPLMLGDERVAQETSQFGVPKDAKKWSDGFEAATRANRQLATALRDQGLNERAAEFAYRAEVCQRHALWHQRQIGQWLFSLMLAGLSGYGFRLSRILAAYGIVVATFALLYFLLGLHSSPHSLFHVTWEEALLASFTDIHGRVGVNTIFPLYSVQQWLAALESVIGIVIEGVFVAMLVQRFFAR